MTLPLPNGAQVQVAPAQVPVFAATPVAPSSLHVIPVVGTRGPTGAAGDGAAVFGESLAGSRDGSNLVFTTIQPYKSHTTAVYRNGLRETRGTCYDESASAEITFTTAPESTDEITVDYIIA